MAALDAALAQVPVLAPLAGQVGLAHALLVPEDAPTVDLPPAQVAGYAGRYADPGGNNIFTQTDGGLELTIEKIAESGAWLPTIAAPPAPPSPVRFLATDMALANGLRLPFVHDAEGRVRWVAAGTRLLPRVEEQA